MSETRTRRRIRAAVESRGYAVAELDWEPIYNGGEMMGWCGGWTLELDLDFLPNTFPGDDMYAQSVDELLALIDYWLAPLGPCGCDRSHDPMTAARLINDPERPTHGPDCEWHIRYRLRWWKSAVSGSCETPGETR